MVTICATGTCSQCMMTRDLVMLDGAQVAHLLDCWPVDYPGDARQRQNIVLHREKAHSEKTEVLGDFQNLSGKENVECLLCGISFQRSLFAAF